MNRAYAKVLAGSLCLLLSQEASSRDNAATQEASVRFKSGVAQVHSGQWEKARLSFLQAYAVLPNADILWNLALAELKTGHVIEGLDHLERYERDPSAEPEYVANLPLVRERAYRELGRIQVEAPAGAKIWIDGGAQPSGGPITNVTPGEHIVGVQVSERSEERTLTVPAGKLVVARFASNDSSAAAAAREPAPTVLNAVESVEPGGAASNDEAHNPPSRGSPNLTLGWVGLGATAGAFALGIGFAVAAKNKDNDAAQLVGPRLAACSYEASLPVCAQARDAVHQRDTMNTVSTVAFVSAGVFALATGGYFLFSRTHGVAIVPYGGVRNGGLAVSGQF
jgi:hypothetical protein